MMIESGGLKVNQLGEFSRDEQEAVPYTVRAYKFRYGEIKEL